MPSHVGLVEKLGKKAGKKGTGKQMLLDMMKKNFKRHQEGKKKRNDMAVKKKSVSLKIGKTQKSFRRLDSCRS